MPYVQNPETHKPKCYKRIAIAGALLMAAIVFTSATRVEAQCTTCPLPTFLQPVSYPIGLLSYGNDLETLGYHEIVAGDFNNDGKPDVVVTTHPSGLPNVHLMLNDGSGGFGETTQIPAPDGFAVSIAAADFNGDHNLDLAVATQTILATRGRPWTLSTGSWWRLVRLQFLPYRNCCR